MATAVVISTLSLAAFAFVLTVFASVRIVRDFILTRWGHHSQVP